MEKTTFQTTKRISLVILIFYLFNAKLLFAQCDTWIQKTNFSGAARKSAIGFSIGNKGYIGTGFDGVSNYIDFWEFKTDSNIWIQKANFGGGARKLAVGFSINNKGYIGTGEWLSSYLQDFWEYIYVIPPIIISSQSSTDVSCNGNNDGTINIIASGGTGTLSFSIDNGFTFTNTTGNFIGLGAGSYDIVIQDDATGCTKFVSTINITEPSAITSTISSTPDTNNTGVGTATIIVSGGVAPYSYSWSPFGGSNASASGLTTGAYTVTVTDNNGCTYQNNVTVGNITNISDKMLHNNLKVYPNPNTGEFILDFKNPDNYWDLGIEIKLLNTIGEVIYEEKINKIKGTYQTKIDISRYAKGIYTLKIISNEGVINNNIIIE